jgi:hypothetical protein
MGQFLSQIHKAYWFPIVFGQFQPVAMQKALKRLSSDGSQLCQCESAISSDCSNEGQFHGLVLQSATIGIASDGFVNRAVITDFRRF